ncbi:hypothetical protein [Vampirovibrio sp.]|uniref:hypothetical protein n=1 Tax=Vampirovibrio sp. TaxID=2717857 RepID=UPI003593CAB2
MNPIALFESSLAILLELLVVFLLIRQLLVVLAAEQGRKYDLVKKLYKPGQEFQLSILVPFLDPNDHPALLQLLHAIHQQDYPASKVTVHLVTAEDTAHELIPQSLRPNVKVWRHPEAAPRFEQALGWIIERCLAAGGNGMFVFLKPTDIVKSDFFQNIAAKGIDSFAIQGYVALKNPPDSLLAQVMALSNRVFNRIGNAGHYHLGMSCRLLDSGWAIKQEVLEMIPYHRGTDFDNLEYTIRLNLQNFRVNWAPSVVVYADSRVNALDYFTRCIGTLFNRLSILARYGPALLTRLVLRFDFNHVEHLIATVNPPYLMAFMLVIVLGLLDKRTQIPIPGEPLFWGVVAALTLVLNAMALVVARCKPNDYATMLIFTPLSYVLGVALSPLSIYNFVRQKLAEQPLKGSSYRRADRTRFNESLDSPPDLFDETSSRSVIHNILKKNAPREDMKYNTVDLPLSPKAKRDDWPDALQSKASKQVAHVEPEPKPYTHQQARETVQSVPLSNGVNQVQCRLKTLTTYNPAGQESYCLTLEYKSVSFSTESYRILDQAFYELHAKLVNRGLTMVTCGSCGNFFNPTADVPGALKNAGVCLFDKVGKEVNLNTDAVTVVSQACDYHCPLDQRESIVRQWKESLSFTRSH